MGMMYSCGHNSDDLLPHQKMSASTDLCIKCLEKYQFNSPPLTKEDYEEANALFENMGRDYGHKA
jgi:hypothetical protein